MAIVQSGSFTSDGTAHQLNIRSDLDYLSVFNYTQAATQQNPGRGVEFRWQRGMAAATGLEWVKVNSTDALTLVTMTSGGFTLIDNSGVLGAAVTGTTITKADPPVCTANSHGYANGDIVVMNTLAEMDQLALVYWEIGSIATNTFELTFMDTNIANFTTETAFVVRRVPKFSTWIPSNVIIVDMTLAATTDVILSAAAGTAGFTVDQVVRLNIPSIWGPSSLDGLTGKITAINTTTNAVTLDIDSSSAAAFGWPASSAVPFTHAQMVPVGIDSATGLGDATRNTDIVGIELGAGAQGPAGSTSDVIYWEAGKSDLVQTS